MKYFKPLILYAIFLLILLGSNTFFEITLYNFLAQALLFFTIVCIPIWRTNRMSYVDIGWPLGLVLLSILSFWFFDGNFIRSVICSGALLLVGLRMGVGAINLWRKGHLKREFPRYEYQRLIWKKENKTNVPLALQVDAIVQGMANASFLSIPIFIISTNDNPDFHPLEIIGLFIFVKSFILESVADFQKLDFLLKMKRNGLKNKVCNVGLWKYSRHPNYFSEWMVWNGFIVASIPSYMALRPSESLYIWVLLGIGLIFTSLIMYSTLVYKTGAVPSEYYSALKRPDYKSYQAKTNRFFPGPIRK